MEFYRKLKINNKTSKTFDYSKGDVKLSFSLRTDVKSQIKDFLECLKIAIKEVEEELNK